MELHSDEMARSAVCELLLSGGNAESRTFSLTREASLIVCESCGAKLGQRKME